METQGRPLAGHDRGAKRPLAASHQERIPRLCDCARIRRIQQSRQGRCGSHQRPAEARRRHERNGGRCRADRNHARAAPPDPWRDECSGGCQARHQRTAGDHARDLCPQALRAVPHRHRGQRRRMGPRTLPGRSRGGLRSPHLLHAPHGGRGFQHRHEPLPLRHRRPPLPGRRRRQDHGDHRRRSGVAR